MVAVALGADRLAGHDPFALAGPPLSAPSGDHPMGTDDLGRDLFSAVVHGARTSLVVAVTTTLLATAIGLVVGLQAGYRGGWVDNALMRLTEFVQIIPRFFLAIVVLAMFGEGYRNLVLVLALSSWPVIARSVRSVVLTVRQRPFVTAAIAIGATRRRVLAREVLPSVVPVLVVLAGLLVADTILIEASLSFLGLGDPDRASWGALAANAQQFLRTAWWLAVFPGLAIVLTVLGVNLLVDDAGADDVR